MERFWLVLAVLAACWAAYRLVADGWQEGAQWLFFPAICAAMWAYRRFTRRKMAAWAERQRQAGGRT
ncbi:MAG: hypothetical protein QM724_05030 [Flavobacteriales bacterium]